MNITIINKYRPREPSGEVQQMLDNINAYEKTPHVRLVETIERIMRPMEKAFASRNKRCGYLNR